MNEVVVFPDIEALLVEALTEPLGVTVSTEVPNPRPPSFVRVTRVGGTRRDLVTDQPLVVVECWATDDVVAGDLGRLTSAHVHALAQSFVGDSWVREVSEVGGLQSFPDPESGVPRYQFTVQIATRGEAL